MSSEAKEAEISTEEKNKERVTFSPFPRFVLYCVLLSIEMSMNNGAGVLSSSSKEIKKQLNLNDKQFGLFGTSQGIGRGIGSLMFTIIVNKFNLKYTICLFVFLKGAFMIAYLFSNSGMVLITLRGFIGWSHMPPSIYIPVWIDQYAFKRYKTTQITMFQVLVPVGKVIGYSFNILYGEHNWKWGFATAGGYMWFTVFIMLFFPHTYFNNSLRPHKTDEDEERHTYFDYTDNKKKDGESESVASQIWECISSPIYEVSNWTRCAIAGFLTAVHYWCADYMRTALGINDPRIIFISYTIACIAGPVGGALIGGLVNNLFGSYEGAKAPYVCFVLQTLATITGVGATFMPNLYTFIAMLMLFLCFNSSALPMCHGFVMVTVRPQIKGIAYAIANLVNMLLVSGTTPMIYGAINDYFKPKGMMRMGMRFTMGANLLGCILLLIFGSMRSRQIAEQEKEKNENLIKEGEELKDQ